MNFRFLVLIFLSILNINLIFSATLSVGAENGVSYSLSPSGSYIGKSSDGKYDKYSYGNSGLLYISFTYDGESISVGPIDLSVYSNPSSYREKSDFPKTNGQCSSSKDTCSQGTFSDRTDSSTQYLWNCNGKGGGSDASCSANKPVTYDSCSQDGVTISHGSSRTFYSSSSVSYGSSCSSQSRSCTDGSLSGSYQYSSCSVDSPESCSQDGVTISHGSSATFYSSSSVPSGSSCNSQTRYCTDGSLSGSYSHALCNIEGAPESCIQDGVTISHGSSATFYSSSSVSYGSSCSSQSRSCTDGSLSGSYQYSSCSVQSSNSEPEPEPEPEEEPELICNSNQVKKNNACYDILNSCPSSEYSCSGSNLERTSYSLNYDRTSCNSNTYTISCTAGCSNDACIPDDDGDGVANSNDNCRSTYNTNQANRDNDQLGDACDLCPSESGQNQYQGCPFAYTNNGCIQSDDKTNTQLKFSLGNLICQGENNFLSDDTKYFRFNKQIVSSGDSPSKTINPNSGTGTYSCYDRDIFSSDDLVGSCDLRHNVPSICQYTIKGTTFKFDSGEAIRFYKYAKILPKEKEDPQFYQIVTCNSNSISSDYKFPADIVTFLDQRYNHVKRASDGTLIEIDTNENTKNRFECDPDDTSCSYVNTDGTVEEVSFETYNTTKTIKVFRQGNLTRFDKIDPELISLKTHKIRRFATVNAAKTYVDEIYQTMNSIDIEKHLNYDGNNTNVQIKLNDIESSGYGSNLVVYQIIPKSEASDISQINMISNHRHEIITEDKDPVIGWYFDDPQDNETIEYEMPGDSEGGETIITQEPILYNEGELIVNYRDTLNCNNDEAHLFNIQSLTNSLVTSPNSPNINDIYAICLAHIIEDLRADNTFSKDLLLEQTPFTYDDSTTSQVSYDRSNYNTEIQISVDNTNYYWDVRVQKDNPTGNYTCLGSINNYQDSTFGDCDYNINNRIWMHLGEDYYPPTTSLYAPAIAHSVLFKLTGVDNIGGSGITDLYYCVDENNTCDPLTSYLTTPSTLDAPNGHTNSSGVITSKTVLEIEDKITCPNDWDCVRYLRYQSKDLENNTEDVVVKQLYMLDKGSACESTCIATPTPNRYLEGCRNLNSCEFYPISTEITQKEKGEYVASQCHLKIQDSWVSLNLTHDVKCPNGPIRETIFTNSNVDLEDSLCNNIYTELFPIQYGGELIQLKVVSCLDNQN